MKILVIGGAGYIGSHVTYKLCDSGYNVTVLDNLSTGFIENIDKRARFVKDSFSNTNILNTILKDIDCVIHLAALKAAGESMEKPIEYSKHNIANSINLINSCIKNNVKSFIFSSTAAVYGHPKYLPLDESHDLEPINYYGFTKLTIENQLLWYNKLMGLNVACLRYFNAAGYDIKGRVRNKENNPQNLLPIVMEVAAGLREKINIVSNKVSAVPNINLDNGMVHYFTTTEDAQSIPNIKSSVGINTELAVGDTASVTIITTAAAAGYGTTIKIDGEDTGALNWVGGTEPSTGGSSGLDIYSYQIIKTANETFTVIGNLTNAASA